MDDAVRGLAEAAGLAVDWINAAGQPQRVSIGSLRRILDGLGYPNGSKGDVAESRKRLRDLTSEARVFYTATVGDPIAVGATRLPAIYEPGYHRKRIGEFGISGMDVLWFQREGNAFLPPSRWRHDAVAMTSTHDLPTVAGWWTGADIATRAALGLAKEKIEAEVRADNRAALWHAFQDAGVAEGDAPLPKDAANAVDAAITFTARSPAAMALVPIEDLLGLTDQPNVPGTTSDDHPNWRRRLDRPAEQVLNPPQARARLKALRER